MSHPRFSVRPNRAHLIHWREWGQATFDDAARQDRLIALFVTAFWCGVCQRLDETTLSSDEVQLLLNACFAPIRIEESQRPDVDLRYTRDGWPTIVFLTPQGAPILSVNAMDPEPFISLLVRLVDAHDKHAIQAAPSEAQVSQVAADPSQLSAATAQEIVHLLRGLADPIHGGFGGPHKHFHTDALAFFLHLGLTEHVKLTLDTLVERAIYDQSDGGFFRYSSQPDWNEPHLEKLLIDQANLLKIYLQAGNYQTIAARLIDYLNGTLGTQHPPFFSGCQDFLPEPIIDDYIYCDANAHLASAYFAAWRVLGRDDCRERAEHVLDGVWATLRCASGGMYHYFDGQPRAPGLLIDSVATGLACLDGHAALGEQRFLERATQLGRDILRLHLNPAGGLFDISQPGPGALQRPMMVLTQNAAAAMLFVRLADATADLRFRDAAQWALLSYSGSAEVYGAYAASFGHALDLFLSPTPSARRPGR